MTTWHPVGIRCQRVWPSIHGGVNLCALRKDHNSRYCIDTFSNASCLTVDTDPSAWDQAMARKAARDAARIQES
jgi:hypothetical protein